MVVNSRFINGVNGIPAGQQAPKTRQTINAGGEFQRILEQKTAGQNMVKFSKHAEMRLQTRNIVLSQNQREKLAQAVGKADMKGVKDSLVLMDNMAFVVNVKNRTVITAANSSELKDSVFTNIDGAVIA